MTDEERADPQKLISHLVDLSLMTWHFRGSGENIGTKERKKERKKKGTEKIASYDSLNGDIVKGWRENVGKNMVKLCKDR